MNGSKTPVFLLLLILSPQILPAIDAYRILFLAPFPVPSHWLWLDHFVREMLDRGHQVTALTNFATKTPHANYTELIIDPPYDLYPTCECGGRGHLISRRRLFVICDSSAPERI